MADTPVSNNTKTDTTPTSDIGLQKPGDVLINKLVLNTVSDQSNVDLRPFFMELHLFEDIFSPTLHGYIVIRDAQNLIGRLPIIGDEILTVDIETPGFGNTGEDLINKIQKSFSVYAVKDRKLNNDREQYYQLFFCSIEASADNIVRLSQKFTGTTDEIVEKIFSENISTPRFFTNKTVAPEGRKTELYIADTPHESQITFVPPMWSPIQCLNWLAKRSIGANYKSPTFLFFETTKAFYFASIEELVAYQIEANNLYSDYVYNTNLDGLQSAEEISRGFATVEAVRFITNLDVIQGQDLGHFASKVFAFDMIKKKYEAFVYDHGFSFKDYKHMESYKQQDDKFVLDETKKFNMIYPINVLRSAEGKSFVSTINPGVLDSTEDSIDLHPEKFVAQRNSTFMDLTTMRMQITVPGRTDAEVGKLIRFYYPSVGERDNTSSESEIWDKLVSGIYMITAIHHQISSLRHTMHMEIAKDSYATPLYDVEEEGA
jgi:hypothetical protein